MESLDLIAIVSSGSLDLLILGKGSEVDPVLTVSTELVVGSSGFEFSGSLGSVPSIPSFFGSVRSFRSVESLDP